MSFFRGADAYDRFMGRYSCRSTRSSPISPLSPPVSERSTSAAARARSPPSWSRRVGTAAVVGRRPLGAVRRRRSGAPPRGRRAARRPPSSCRSQDGAFDATLAQLVVHFMADPVAGLGEMARVTRPGGVVAACVWDHGGGQGPLSPFWDAARELDPGVDDESQLAGAREGHSAELFQAAGTARDRGDRAHGRVEHPTSRSGGSRSRSASARPARTSPVSTRRAGRSFANRCRERLPSAPFVLEARAWAARGRAA